MKTAEDETTTPAQGTEVERAPYSKPMLTQLGLLRTLTQGYF